MHMHMHMHTRAAEVDAAPVPDIMMQGAGNGRALYYDMI